MTTTYEPPCAGSIPPDVWRAYCDDLERERMARLEILHALRRAARVGGACEDCAYHGVPADMPCPYGCVDCRSGSVRPVESVQPV